MERQPYDSDLSDAEWDRIRPLLPASCPRGRPIEVPRREIVNAILYVLRAGCAWRLLPPGQPQSRAQARIGARIQGWRPMRSRSSPMDTSGSNGC